MQTPNIPFLHSIKKLPPPLPPSPIRAPSFGAIIVMRDYDVCGYAVLLHGLWLICGRSNIAPRALGG